MFNPTRIAYIDFQGNEVTSEELEFKAQNVYEGAEEYRREAEERLMAQVQEAQNILGVELFREIVKAANIQEMNAQQYCDEYIYPILRESSSQI